MASFFYNYQNPLVCCFLVQIKDIVFLNLSRIDKFKQESKTKWILVVAVKCRHRENGLLACEQAPCGVGKGKLPSLPYPPLVHRQELQV